MTVWCETCHQPAEDDDKFCCFCGSLLRKNQPTQSVPAVSPPSPASPAVFPNVQPFPSPVEPIRPPKPVPISQPPLHEVADDEDITLTTVMSVDEESELDEEDYSPTVVVTVERQFLVRKATEEEFELSFPCVVGRGSKCECRITGNPTISRQHLRLVETDEGVLAQDLGAKNSTYVNDAALPADAQLVLHNGDVLRLGDEEFTYVDESE